jgi:hypothetical protein
MHIVFSKDICIFHLPMILAQLIWSFGTDSCRIAFDGSNTVLKIDGLHCGARLHWFSKSEIVTY